MKKYTILALPLLLFIAFLIFILNLGRVRVYEFAGPNIKGRCSQPEPQFVIQIYPGQNFTTADYNSFGEQEMKIIKPSVEKFENSKIRLQALKE